MDDFEKILKDLPEKPARSRLEPYGRLINMLLRRGRTYRDIARILAEKCHLRVSISTIHDLVRVRYRPKRQASKGPRPKTDPGLKTITTVRTEEKDLPTSDMSAADDVYQRIAAFKQRPASPPETIKVFHYDPDEPLHLHEKIEPKKSGK